MGPLLLLLLLAAFCKPIPALSAPILFLDSFSRPDVDLSDTRAPGWTWYVHPFFGGHRNLNEVISFGQQGVTLQNAVISTAALADDHHHLIGRAFGGPLYIEATLSEGRKPANAKGWPAFWAMAAEHVAGGQDDRDPDGRGERFIEDDLLERDTAFAGASTYGATLHDWSGHYQVECHSGYCDTANNGHGAPNNFILRPSPAVDWSQPHRVGQLIMPASRGHPGTIQNFFDGRPIGSPIHWSGRRDAFGVLDSQHLVIFLQAGDQPMTVHSLRISRP